MRIGWLSTRVQLRGGFEQLDTDDVSQRDQPKVIHDPLIRTVGPGDIQRAAGDDDEARVLNLDCGAVTEVQAQGDQWFAGRLAVEYVRPGVLNTSAMGTP